MTQDLTQLDHDELTDLWIGAFRYYCGRSTIASVFFADMLIDHKDIIPNAAKIVMVRDLEREIQRNDSQTLGHECDREKWEQVYRELKPE